MKMTPQTISSILGKSLADFISAIAEQAQQESMAIYLVGGMVRDFLLERANLDLDFVLEGDAIAFTHRLVDRFGGSLQSHASFGTAKWILDSQVADRMALTLDNLPPHIDFASARTEHYEQPAALPTVYPGDIQLDLQRRDFTVNALAIQLGTSWRTLDLHGGIADLNRKLIRVLHPRSFIDDPTRILRAVRLAQRLRFMIEPQTAQWLQAALPMLRQTTGERLRNELALTLCEQRPAPAILKLQALGILESIHPAFRVSPQLPDLFERCREQTIPWKTATPDLTRLYWHMLMVGMTADDAQSICQRLGLTQALAGSIRASLRLIENAAPLKDSALRPSQITQFLENMNLPPVALQAVWLALMNEPLARQRIEAFIKVWCRQGATINGNDLKKMGLRPGPRYKLILQRLRFAWIDGELESEAEERTLLNQLLATERLSPAKPSN